MADPNPNPNPIYRARHFIDISEEEEETQMDDGSDLPVPAFIDDVEEENNDAGEDNFEYDFTVSDEEEDNELGVEQEEEGDSIDPDYALFLGRLAAQNSAGVAAGTQPSAAAEGGGGRRRRIGEPGTSASAEIGDSMDPDYESFLARLAAQSSAGVASGAQPRAAAEGGGGKRRRIGEPITSAPAEIGEGSRGGGWNLFCSICLEAWTNDGDHSICCLPCGHLFGMSCIRRWLVRRNCGKCPQCNRKSKVKDIRRLFVSRIAAVDKETQKRIRTLEEKCGSLEEKCSSLEKEVAGYRKKEAEWTKKLRRGLRHVKMGPPVEDIPVHDLEDSSSEDYESAIRLLEEELAAGKACKKPEAELQEEKLASWQQYWDQVMQLNARFPDIDIPPVPDFRSFASLPPETQPNHHAGADEGRTSG